MSGVGWGDAGDARPSGWLVTRPLWKLVALDAAWIVLAAAAVAQLGEPDVLLHVVWIVLAIEAFAFGLRIAILRIAAATLFVILYAVVANGEGGPVAAAMADLDLAEWPLMVVIAVIVAVMADRVILTGRRYAALYRAASDRLMTAQEDERRRLAADLHDGVGQTMTALALTLDAAEAALANSAATEGAGLVALRRAREMAGMALDDVRGVAFRLRPARLRETGLVAALGELSLAAGLPVDFSADASLLRPDLLDPAREVDTYRIVQEALGNAARHARSDRIQVSVRRADRLLRVEVADAGIGFDVTGTDGRGLGLASMRDRASAVRGHLQVRSRPGAGTVVRLDVPLADGVLAALDEIPASRGSAGLPARSGAPVP